MLLRRVELFGFKSFPDRTTFDFEKGVTAILGPNGCGKSNVVDAIKWVLGEKSARNLRGSEMRDVIFSGCDSRRPSALAEVNLWFDNSDQKLAISYNEVCISRRLYRSGESEYLINRNPCRWRDIRDLLLDTGAGSSAYSIIEQGRVESLLHAKPADRRAVFEEAAGIAKYKVHRKEIIARLERTKQILLRVSDRMEEKDRDIRRVANQARAARRHRRLKAELDAARTCLYTRQYRDQTAKVEVVRADRATLAQRLAADDAEMAALSPRLAALAAGEIELEREREAAVSLLAEAQEELGRLMAEKAEASSRLESMGREAEDSRARQESLRVKMADLALRDTESRKDLESARLRADELGRSFLSGESERGRLAALSEEAERTVTALRNGMIDANSRRQELVAAVARAESDEQSQAARLREIEERLLALAEEEGKLAAVVAELRAAYDAASATAAKLADDLTKVRESEKARRQAMEETQRGEQVLRDQHAAKSARLAALEELENSFSGAFEGVKAVLTARREGRDCQGVRGMAADLMTVPLDVALAIETILGNQAQDIIIDSAGQAQSCIEFLKRGRLGRATFLPLDRIQPRRRLERNLRHIPGVIGEAVDLVTFEPAYRSAMEHLLAGILIVDNLSLARDLAGREARGVRIVTLEGDVISPSGAMTGGNGKQQRAGLVQRKAEQAALTTEIAELDQRRKAAAARRDEIAAELEKAAADAGELEKALAVKGREGRDMERDLSVRDNELSRLRRDLAEAERNRSGFGEASAACAERRRAAREEMDKLAAEMAELEQRIESANQEQRQRRSDLDALGSGFASLSADLATAKATVGELERRLSDMERERLTGERDLAALENTSARGELLDSLKQRLEEATRREIELLRLRDERRALVAELGERLAASREELQAARERERECQTQIARLRDGMAQLDLREQECRLKIEALAQKAREELGVEDLAAATIEPLPESEPEAEGEAKQADEQPLSAMDDAALHALALDLAGKLQRLGPVNFEAIDELTELEASAEFLRGQKDDLESAVADMRGAIDRLNDESARRFQETFVTVRTNFQAMFTRLFGGGRADLILEEVTDPEADPLDAGIDIRAQPPGKEPKNISLLSGGEKALCAVALLFALFQSKPSPFCILDEVDGPLDESNIDRFMQQVRDFSSHTQFVLISHAKRTMGMVDAIWGVTQTEPGVSTRHSLKFSSIKKTEQDGERDVMGAAG